MKRRRKKTEGFLLVLMALPFGVPEIVVILLVGLFLSVGRNIGGRWWR